MSIPVFYDPMMVAPEQSGSPSASKPLPVVESWRRQFPVRLEPVTPVRRDELKLAHSPAYVDAVLTGRRSNGFGNRDAAVARSLHYTVGSMLSAARYAVARGGVAVSPSSGFHHAGYDSGGGFCTFNGLMVAAIALKQAGLVRRVGILDCDAHYGDGTDDIIDELGIDYVTHCTGFLQSARWRHMCARGGAPETPRMQEWLTDALDAVRDCDLVLYQAGADPHVDDPLGGYLTTEDMLRRDEMVFAQVRAPLVWNLAGGYQNLPQLLKLHDNTMRACVARYVASKGDRVRARWLRSAALGTFSLAGAQVKLAASEIEVTGTVRHVRGDHPTDPSEVRLFLDCDRDADIPLVRPPGCTCPHGHVEIRPEWLLGRHAP